MACSLRWDAGMKNRTGKDHLSFFSTLMLNFNGCGALNRGIRLLPWFMSEEAMTLLLVRADSQHCW